MKTSNWCRTDALA